MTYLTKVDISFNDRNEFLDIVEYLDQNCLGMWYYKASWMKNRRTIYLENIDDVQVLENMYENDQMVS